jgi:hypothetical protein
MRIAERRQPHHLALVALAGKDRLRQHKVEHAQSGGLPLVALPQLFVDAIDPVAPGHVEGRHFAPVARHVGGAAPLLGEIGHGAALAVDDHDGRIRERRRMEGAI